jgi:hypothetical protein
LRVTGLPSIPVAPNTRIFQIIENLPTLYRNS